MSAFASVLCAVDTSDESARVIRHAAVLAARGGGHLTVLTITDGDRPQTEDRLDALLATALPVPVPSLDQPRLRVVRLTQGGVADAILEFARDDADLIVMGTHARGGLSRWLLGSTSEAVLEQTPCPVFLLPPGPADVVSVTPAGVRLSFGTVIAAVDLEEHNDVQIRLAGRLAADSGQPLVLMTVAAPETGDQDAERALAERARSAAPATVHHLVVRRGIVATEIARAAVAEPAALVVMGLREPGHGLPGEIASQVLHGKDTIVLAVPAR